LLTSWAALRSRLLPRPLNSLGLVIGAAGIMGSVAPALNELGYAFGVGVIVWWIWLGIVLLRSSSAQVAHKNRTEQQLLGSQA
jgi:hypothetical protein